MRIMLLFVVVAAYWSTSARAGDVLANNGLTVGQIHMVTARVRPTRGLEVGMPVDGWYARGIAFDIQGRWRESYQAYSRAYDEYAARLRRQPARGELIRGWMAKTKHQILQSSRLLTSSKAMYVGASAVARVYDRATVKHNKFLAIRAFTGRAPRKLQREVLTDYRTALQLQPAHQGARLGLAAFLHELGLHDEGRIEFAKVVQPIPEWMARELAYYYATAGDTELSFYLLQLAIRGHSRSRSQILTSNDFDRLRNHPRFQRLVGRP